MQTRSSTRPNRFHDRTAKASLMDKALASQAENCCVEIEHIPVPTPVCRYGSPTPSLSDDRGASSSLATTPDLSDDCDSSSSEEPLRARLPGKRRAMDASYTHHRRSTRTNHKRPPYERETSPVAGPSCGGGEERTRQLVKDMRARDRHVSDGKAPAPVLERALMKAVFDELTPYPDEVWISHIADHTDRSYVQVKNWFSNQRQKVAKEEGKGYWLPSMVSKVKLGKRTMRFRTVAVEKYPKDVFTDEFLVEMLLITKWRLIALITRFGDEEVAERVGLN